MNLLILLIGGNPIANYALIEYFNQNGDITIPKCDKVLLIHTNFSEDMAENIKKLKSSVDFELLNLEDRENSLKYIQNSILKKLNSIESIDSIHLNYTGGRKPMSLGAYLAVDEYKKCHKIYSDISPKTYKLTLFDGSSYPLEGSISSNIDISIKDFYTLHGLKDIKFQKENSEFYSEEFCMFLLEQNTNNEKEFYEKLWDLNSIKELAWRESIKEFIKEDISNKKLSKLQKFIRGNWLEEYLFVTLEEIKHQIGITDLAWSVEAKHKGKDFEVDVVAIVGYKSFVFSCTTDKKAHIKQKAFEAIIRSRQLGGIGSKTILVSLTDKEGVEGVKQDSYTERSFEALGIEDIGDKTKFKQRLEKIFKDR